MPIQAINPNFSRGISSLMGTATQNVQNVGGIARDYLDREERDVKEATRKAEAARTAERQDKLLGLQEQAGQRAQETLADTQARQAMSDYTQGEVGRILSEPDVGKRQEMLKTITTETGGFTPSAQESKLLLDATTPAVPKEQTGTVTIGKDGKYTTVPVGLLGQFQDQGWTPGKPFSDKETGTKKKDYSPIATGEWASGLDIDLFGSGDTRKAISSIQKTQDALGLSTKEAESIAKQSITGLVNKSLDAEALAKALEASGKIKNEYYIDEKGKRQVLSGKKMAEALMNENIEIRTNPDGSRVFVDLSQIEQPVVPQAQQSPAIMNQQIQAPVANQPRLLPPVESLSKDDVVGILQNKKAYNLSRDDERALTARLLSAK